MEASWTTHEDETRIEIVHDNRWLAIIGVPLALGGVLIAVGPWFIDEARTSGAWPILAVGSLIGTGIVVMGLALCFKYDKFTADRRAATLRKQSGLPPFQRCRSWSLAEVTAVVCDNDTMGRGSTSGSSTHYRFLLATPGKSILLASTLEPEPILEEALRWADFLQLPIEDHTKSTRKERLAQALKEKSSPAR